MIAIGSVALARHLDIERPVADLDIVGTYDEIEAYRKGLHDVLAFYPFKQGRKMFIKLSSGIVEADIAWPDSVEEKLHDFIMAQHDTYYDRGLGMYVPALDVLYMLKMSHRFLKDSPHFLKTMEDIHFMRKYRAVIRPEHREFYEQRKKDTYVYAHPKLNVTKETFFDAEATGVKYTYDHDSIHEAVKLGERPAYTYYKPVDSQVMCSEEMFWNVSERIRLAGVYEEACVLALERSLVPYPGVLTPKQAFDKALEKVATSITSGFFREFSYEAYYDVQKLYNDDYVTRFYKGVEDGVVKLAK